MVIEKIIKKGDESVSLTEKEINETIKNKFIFEDFLSEKEKVLRKNFVKTVEIKGSLNRIFEHAKGRTIENKGVINSNGKGVWVKKKTGFVKSLGKNIFCNY